jgi:hypothetical protein
MSEPSLKDLEQEVEAARAKLTGDLSTLRSPTTAAEFTDVLKQEAIQAKDAIFDKAKQSAKASVETLIEDIKGRAAANPTAALAIGAGLAWRLITHPPIATALIGAGLLSLFRTSPVHPNGGTSADYFAQARHKFLEQAKETAHVAMGRAAAVGEVVSETVAETAAEIGHPAGRLTQEATSTARGTAHAAEESANEMWNEISAATISNEAARDKLLLGVAGLAVVTALRVAYQRRDGKQI